MLHEDNPKSIKYYVKRFFLRESARFANKTVVDFPAGNGVTSKLLKSIGAKPLAFDLFPEYFKVDGLTCQRADINTGIPIAAESVDAVMSQEGIEHFENQLLVLNEFNRILKVGGSLIITTPNYSNLIGRLSFLLSENERFNKGMAPNELDDIWMSNKELSDGIYYGHIFLIGIQKLRTLAKLSGFSIRSVERTKIKTTALILLPILYPFIFLSSTISYYKTLKKNKATMTASRKSTYYEIYKLSINIRSLLNSHIFIEFVKDHNTDEIHDYLSNQHKSFGTT